MQHFHILPPEIDECSCASDDESPTVHDIFAHVEYTERDSHGASEASTISESVFIPHHSPKLQPKRKIDKAQRDENKDVEIKDAREREAVALNAFLMAKAELDQAVADRDERMSNAEKRMDRFEQQKTQLERIKNDVESMEQELLALDQNSKETRQMSEGFVQGTYMPLHDSNPPSFLFR